jgi:hypothetical protein
VVINNWGVSAFVNPASPRRRRRCRNRYFLFLLFFRHDDA